MNRRLSELIRKKYPITTMSPGEFSALHGHKHHFLEQYSDHGDNEITKWFNEVLRILGDPKDYERARLTFLSQAQKREIDSHLAVVASRLRETYPVETMSPQEYVGRNSHKSNSLQFHSELHHGDVVLQEWFGEVMSLLRDYGEADRLRRKYLGKEELMEVDRQISETQKSLRELYLIDRTTPEEFVAHNSHKDPSVDDNERHFDEEIRDWLDRVCQLLKDSKTCERLRRELLSASELEKIRLYQDSIRRQILEVYPVETVTAEEFAARHSHQIYMLGMACLDHGDQRIKNWFDELQIIMANQELLNELRERLLSPEELSKVKAEIEEQSKPGYVP